jgi:adenylylsulfate kinase
MAEKATNIHPIFDGMLQRSDKENLLNQKSLCLWMTGLSGSGKSTIAKGVEQKLHELGFLVQILDGDNIRTGINSNLGFSEEPIE